MTTVIPVSGLEPANPSTITHSVIPLLDSIENTPPTKFSERHILEMTEILVKKPQRIRLITYNILFNVFDDQLDDKNYSWIERLPKIVQSIKNMQPDILCLQEAYPTQIQDLYESLKNNFDYFKGTSTTGEINAIFYNKERFQLDLRNYKNETIDLSSASFELPLNSKDEKLVAVIPDFLPPELEPGRQLTLAHFLDKVTGKYFTVINTHLTYYRINAREDQAYFILELVKNLQALKKPVFLTGDFNTISNRPDQSDCYFYDGNHIEQIFQKALKDTKDVALLGHVGPLCTFVKNFLNTDSESFKKFENFTSILDHIYVSPEISVIIHATEPSQVNGYFPSDHLPVIADVILP